MLVIPPGFLIVAMPLNNKPAAGIRKSFLCRGLKVKENLTVLMHGSAGSPAAGLLKAALAALA